MSRTRVTFKPFAAKIKATAGRELYSSLLVAGKMVQVEAATSITKGSRSGKHHVSSRPGEPPNADTRQLDTSIKPNRVKDMKVDVVASAPYAAPLEFGTKKMAARPFMRPALRNKEGEVRETVTKALKKAIADSSDR